MSTLEYWAKKFAAPFCKHEWEVVGAANQRSTGECSILRCKRCGAYMIQDEAAESERHVEKAA